MQPRPHRRQQQRRKNQQAAHNHGNRDGKSPHPPSSRFRRRNGCIGGGRGDGGGYGFARGRWRCGKWEGRRGKGVLHRPQGVRDLPRRRRPLCRVLRQQPHHQRRRPPRAMPDLRRAAPAGLRSELNELGGQRLAAEGGDWPVHIRYKTQPRLNKSARPSTGSARACSGAM